MTLVLFPTKKTYFHQDCLFFAFFSILWSISLQLWVCFCHRSEVQSNLWDRRPKRFQKRIFPLRWISKPKALFGNPDESDCSVLCSLMPFKCQRERFLFSSFAFFTLLEICFVLCSEVYSMLMSGCWWKHLYLSETQFFCWGELKELWVLQEYVQR